MATALSPEYLKAQAVAAEFDAKRKELAEACQRDLNAGMNLTQIAKKLNAQGLFTKTGKLWSCANVHMLLKYPDPPAPKTKSKAARAREKHAKRRRGVKKSTDLGLTWVSTQYPHLEEWRVLAEQWLRGREGGLTHAINGIKAFFEFLGRHQLTANPAEFLLNRTCIPDFYESQWGKKKSHGKVLIHNNAHFFLQWVLTQPQFCEEDDFGQFLTSPAFRNPLPHLSRSGLPKHYESVRPTLPYGYIEELRQMIAQGPHFRDWKWAQNALGMVQNQFGGNAGKKDKVEDDDDEGDKVARIWFEVEPGLIDRDDPDCVWRTRTRTVHGVPGAVGGGRDKETIYEMWSPVRWVALLIKLQLPLRAMQVRMLDSGEADTWKWEGGTWTLNPNLLAQGAETRPYTNGIFLKPNELIDGDAKVLLHINTNKTADIGKAGNQKGYNVPWIVGGPLHQDPFYWLEKLRRWQEKYNPITRLTKWEELDGRHITAKSEVQLSAYPDTAFLFRTPEDLEHPNFPLGVTVLNRPWFLCLDELERRLYERGELLPSGGRIRLIPELKSGRKNFTTTLFSLHSLRVSLITALALDGEVPLAILQKIAGHSRLVMTLYYTKPGAKQAQEALQAGVERLNESGGETIINWLATTEYNQLVKEVIANSPEAFKVAVPELIEYRSPAGWMVMVDGLCLVGGNNVEPEAPGCHNGGPNIGNESAPKYAPVPGGARNCPRCRWFITRPYFLPQLAARWNNMMYHCSEAREQVVIADARFRDLEDRRAAAISAGELFKETSEYLKAQRLREQAIQKFDDLTMTVAAITKLLDRCRTALHSGDGTALIGGGTAIEFEFAIQEVSSELLQLSGVSEGSELYPDLDPGKAVLRQSQLLDAALMRDNLPPVFLLLSEHEQQLVGNAFIRQLAVQMNRNNPVLGRHQVISLIDAGESLRQRLGPGIEEVLKLATSEAKSKRVIPIKVLSNQLECHE